MNNFTKTLGKAILLFSILFFQNSLYAQGTCATAVTLTAGTQQCGDTADGGDTFDDNACLGSYDGGDDYLFVVTVPAGEDGNSLQLDLTSAGSWTGIAISEGCPEGGGGTCFGASTSSSGDESLLSDPLTGGNTYYIHISTWPSPQSATFCLDAAYAAPPSPPANDLCTTAEVVTPTEGAGTCVTGTNLLATDSGEASPSCAGGDYAGGDIWYSITVPAGQTQVNYARTASAFSTTYYALYSGACGALVEEDCGTSTTDQFTGLTAGETYYLRLFDWGNNDIGDVTFCLSVPAAPPANDACAGALPVLAGISVGSMNTASATDVEGLAPCSGGGGSANGVTACAGGTGTIDWSPGVWYSYTSVGPGIITVDTDGSSFDTEIQIFEGSCGALTCLGGDDDAGAGSQSSICWESTATLAPVTYYIYIDGHAGASGDLVLNITLAPLPVDLISFEGKVEEKSNMLMWETASEENTEKHVIERSVDGRDNWVEIGNLKAAGFTSETQSYMLEDKNPMTKAYYRLRSIDFDASENISEVIYLERRQSNTFDIISVFPNPTKAGLTVDFGLVEDVRVQIRLTDMLGKTVAYRELDAKAGINSEQFDMNNLASGVYFININNGTTQLTERILKN